MKVSTTKLLPSSNELVGILNWEFSDRYTFDLFGLGAEKSIIVQKSTFIGVQISKRSNEISIEGVSPSTISRVILFADSLFFGLMGWAVQDLLFGVEWKKLEKEIGFFLKKKYN